MKLEVALRGVHRLFLDTAPVIYYVEGVSPRFEVMDAIVQRAAQGSIRLVTSTITLAECLVLPLRRGDTALAARFRRALTEGVGTDFVGVDRVAEQAAALRAASKLTLADAFQVACAVGTGCEGFLTNDRDLAVVSAPRILVLDDLEV